MSCFNLEQKKLQDKMTPSQDRTKQHTVLRIWLRLFKEMKISSHLKHSCHFDLLETARLKKKSKKETSDVAFEQYCLPLL